MSPSIRTLLASLLIASVAPIGLAVLDLEQPAFAKNGGGNGGNHGGGNGNGHGGGHGNGHGQSANAKTDSDTVANAESHKSSNSTLGEEESDGLAPNELGKLNGVLHASPTAIAHANVNSPIGTARAFGEALADFLDSLAPEDEDTTGDEATTEEDTTAEEETDPVTVDELGEMMANMTNKPVTAEQVEAVADKLGIETTDEESDQVSEDQTSEDQPADDTESPTLDPDTAQAIADKANEIHGFTDDTTDDEGDTSDDTADAGDTTDETVTN